MSAANTNARDLSIRKEFHLGKFLSQWEMILVYILILINVILAVSGNFSGGTLSTIIQSGMDLSFMVPGMIFILLLGDIDVSVAAIMVVAGMVMGYAKQAGMPDVLVVLLGLLAGAFCGLFNGVLVAKLRMPAVIVTIATSLLFRGVAEIIMNVNVLTTFPDWFKALAWDNVAGIPISFICFTAVMIIFAVVLHRSKFGRELYMVGNSATVSEYSGVRVVRLKLIVFVLMGVMAGVSAIFCIGRLGNGLIATVGKGYELNVIAIAVLGGVSPVGGRGKVYGPFIATLIMAFLNFTMGLLQIDANPRQIFTGLILIVAVLIPLFNRQFLDNIRLKLLYADNKNIEAVNNRCREEVAELRRKIAVVRKDSSLTASDRDAKARAMEDKIAALRKKCAQTTRVMKQEMEEEKQKPKKLLSR